MAKILIKRGLQANIDALVLAEGELAVALDTGNVYIGVTGGKTHINPTGGTADVAVTLKTAQNFSITGDGTAEAVAFDGSDAVALNLVLNKMEGLAAGTYTKLTVNEKGQVTGATTITVEDLPSIPHTKVTGLGTAATLNTGTAAGNVIVVGSDGKIDESLIPAVAISETFEAASETEMLALTAQRGDICIRSDENKSYILTAEPATSAANWKWLKTPDSAVLSVNGKTGAVTLSYSDVGAEQVLTEAAEKNNIVDADNVIIQDSATSNATKKLPFANLKAALKTYFDTLYNKYVHPTHTAKAAGLYKVTVDGEGHVSAATAVTKNDITNLGVPAQDTTYTFTDGLTVSGTTVGVGNVDGGTF